MKSCSCDTDISRDGAGRLGRFLKALDPSYNPIDDRNLTDLLVFTKRFANQVRFYKLAGDNCNEDGSWREFFNKDIAILAASISSVDLEQIEKDYLETRTHFDNVRTLDAFLALFNPILGMATRMDKWLTSCSPDFLLYHDLQLIVRSIMRDQILKIFELDKSAVVVFSNELGIDFEPVNETVWDLDVNISFVSGHYTGTTPEDKLFHASLFVDTIFNASFGALNKIVGKSDAYLYEAIEKYPWHQPHMALFIAFLELFRLAQQQLNGLTEKHLNFYYRDVLHLKEKPAQPDHVNLIFELAKDALTYHLPKGTPVSGGKDEAGVDQVYLTDRDMVINNAVVKDIKNIYIDQCREGQIKGFYSRSAANSADGKGAAFTNSEGRWNAFGSDALKHQSGCGQVIKHTGDNFARIGFAIASPQLRLEGGNRIIGLKIKGISSVLTRSQDFEIKLTGEKGWVHLDKPLTDTNNAFRAIIIDNFPEESTYGIDPDSPDTIAVFLPKSEQAILGYNDEQHSEEYFPTSQPVLQILLRQDVQFIDPAAWENTVVDFNSDDIDVEGQIVKQPRFELTTNVLGLRKVIIQNEQGVQPENKPFYPFTPLPTPGSPLLIGIEEMFNKPIEYFSIHYDRQIANNDSFGDFQVSVLSGKDWKPVQEDHGRFHINTTDREQVAFSEWTQDLDKGFIKVTFDGDIQPDPASLMQLGNRSKMNGVLLDYVSAVTTLDENIDQFFHVYPFGVAETSTQADDPDISRQASKLNISFTENKTGKIPVYNRIFPDFKFGFLPLSLSAENIDGLSAEEWTDIGNIGDQIEEQENEASFRRSARRNEFSFDQVSGGIQNQYNGALRQEGTLFIGVEGLVPPQNLSLLFQIAEGTAIDDDKDPPAINWSYLSDNQWKVLPPSNILLDKTYGLQATGILLLDIPEDAMVNNTIMPGDLHWISASVERDSHRIPYIVNVVAQAVPAIFSDQGNAAAHYENPLPASTISKMVVKPAEIKSVDQPFASYNGVPAEIGKEFYMRISERLKHKNRAVTAHDYEKLVLEYFPDIFKVKCITHADPDCLCRDTEEAGTEDCTGASVMKFEINDNGVNSVQGTIVDAVDGSPLVGASIQIKGGAAGPVTDSSGKFSLNIGTVNDVLIASNQGYVTQEVSVSRSVTNSVIRLRRETKDICCGPQVAPGHVLIVPIENLKNRNAINILQPRTSYRVLREIEAFLAKRTSPFVKVHARNPVYEEILTAFRVQFQPGLDKGYFLKQLNEDIRRFLTPWVFDDSVDVVFNNRIFASSVINFIEERPYVNFISDFMMYQVICSCCGTDAVKDEVISTAKRAKKIADKMLAAIPAEEPDKTVNPLDVARIINKQNHPARFLTDDADALMNFIRDESETMVEWIIRNVLSWFEISGDADLQTQSNKYEQQLVVKVVEWYINLVKSMGLKTIADLMKYLPQFKMVTLAEPANDRAIMVSAQQHIIMLYEEEKVPNPCEKNSLTARRNA